MSLGVEFMTPFDLPTGRQGCSALPAPRGAAGRRERARFVLEGART